MTALSRPNGLLIDREKTRTPGPIARWWIAAQRSNLLRVRSLAGRIRRAHRVPPHLEIGERGELEALFHLRLLGFQVIERRWRTPELSGDVDLIAWEGNTLCFIEVKARTVRDLTPAASAVDRYKRRMLARMARAFVRTLPQAEREIHLRFDIVSVYLLPAGVECELLRDAFDPREANFS